MLGKLSLSPRRSIWRESIGLKVGIGLKQGDPFKEGRVVGRGEGDSVILEDEVVGAVTVRDIKRELKTISYYIPQDR